MVLYLCPYRVVSLGMAYNDFILYFLVSMYKFDFILLLACFQKYFCDINLFIFVCEGCFA